VSHKLLCLWSFIICSAETNAINTCIELGLAIDPQQCLEQSNCYCGNLSFLKFTSRVFAILCTKASVLCRHYYITLPTCLLLLLPDSWSLGDDGGSTETECRGGLCAVL